MVYGFALGYQSMAILEDRQLDASYTIYYISKLYISVMVAQRIQFATISIIWVAGPTTPRFIWVEGQDLIKFLLKNLKKSFPVIFRIHLGSEFHRLHAVQAKELSVAFLALPLMGKIGTSHLHPFLPFILKVSPYFLEMFVTRFLLFCILEWF